MTLNIIDRRERRYRWKAIDAIIEPTHQDNSVDGSDQAYPTTSARHTMHVKEYSWQTP